MLLLRSLSYGLGTLWDALGAERRDHCRARFRFLCNGVAWGRGVLSGRIVGLRRLLKVQSEISTRVAHFALGHLSRAAFNDDMAAGFAPFGTKVDDPV